MNGYVEAVAELLRDRPDVSDVETEWIDGTSGIINGWRIRFTHDRIAMVWRVVAGGSRRRTFVMERDVMRDLVAAEVGPLRSGPEVDTAERLVMVSTHHGERTPERGVEVLMSEAATVRDQVATMAASIVSGREYRAPLDEWRRALADAGVDTSMVRVNPASYSIPVDDLGCVGGERVYASDSAYVDLFPDGKWRLVGGLQAWSTGFMVRLSELLDRTRREAGIPEKESEK